MDIPRDIHKMETASDCVVDGQFWEKVIAEVPGELKHMLIASIRETVPSNEAIKQAVQTVFVFRERRSTEVVTCESHDQVHE
jgi:hypothetical protein